MLTRKSHIIKIVHNFIEQYFSMLCIASRLVLSKHFLIFALLPIFFGFIANIGLIFNIGNQIPLLFTIVVWLSSIFSNSYILDILIGQITIFLVFFSLIQFSFNNKSIPSWVIQKYLIKSEQTERYLGLQFGIVISLSALYIFSMEGINLSNIILSVFYLIASALISLAYFFWILEVTQPENMFNFMCNTIDFNHLFKTDELLKRNYTKYEEERKQLKVDSDSRAKTLSVEENLILEKVYPEISGVLIDIDVKGLQKLFEDFSENLIAIEPSDFYSIGEVIYFNQSKKDIWSPASLCSFTIKVDDKITNSKISDISNCIRNCFHIEYSIKHKKIFEDIFVKIFDLLFFYLQSSKLDEDKQSIQINSIFEKLNKVNDLYQNDVEKEINGVLKDSANYTVDSQLFTNLSLQMIKIFKIKADGSNFDDQFFEKALSFVYSVKFWSVAAKNKRIMRELGLLLYSLLFRITIEPSKYRYYLASIILYFKEVGTYNILRLKLSDYDSLKYLQNFHKPIIMHFSDVAVHVYRSLLQNYFKLDAPERESIITQNGNYLIKFLDSVSVPFFPMNPTDDNKEVFNKEILEILYYHGYNLLRLSISIEMLVRKKLLPPEILLMVAFPLTANCNSHIIMDTDATAIINDFIFKNYMNDSQTIPWNSVFEIQGISHSGANTIVEADIFFYWIVYSFYNYLRHNFSSESFYPRKSNQNANVNHTIQRLNRSLDDFSRISLTQELCYLDFILHKFAKGQNKTDLIFEFVTTYRKYLKVIV